MNGTFYIGVYGAACGLFLLIACLIWRDRRSNRAGRLGALLALTAATGAVNSVPGFHDGAAAWQMPIMALGWAAPAIFWLWARVPEHRLRQAINAGLGHRNFNAFLNHYRVEEAKAALADPGQNEVPVLTIAMDAGFQSIGPFNRAFKTNTGKTPTDYRSAARARHLLGPDFAPKTGIQRADQEIGQPNRESGEMKPGISRIFRSS